MTSPIATPAWQRYLDGVARRSAEVIDQGLHKRRDDAAGDPISAVRRSHRAAALEAIVLVNPGSRPADAMQ
jgi:hypothetical protein